MSTLKAAFLISLALPFALKAQSTTDLNEGRQVSFNAATNSGTFTWYGENSLTYFIMKSDDLSSWTYAPVIERGYELPISWNFSFSNGNFFFRLRYTDVDMGDDPWGFDLDGDSISNRDELNQATDPFAALDGTPSGVLNGIPDDWELFWDDVVAVYSSPLEETFDWDANYSRSLYVKNGTSSRANFTTNTVSAEASGYLVNDSLTGSVVYNWTEISSSGTELTTVSASDNDSEIVSIGFDFPFYGVDYDSVIICSNGFISLREAYNSSSNQAFPSYAYQEMNIAPFWDDLDAGKNGTVYYQEFTDHLVVQYDEVAKDDNSGNVTFQVVLYDDGTIEFFYQDLNGDVDECTVGIQNLSGNSGVTIIHNDTYLVDNLGIRIGPNKKLLTVTPLSGTVGAGEAQLLELEIDTNAIAPGDYSGDIQITHAGSGTSPWSIPFEYTVAHAKMTQPFEGYTLLEGESLNHWSLNSPSAMLHDTPTSVVGVEFRTDSIFIGQDTISTTNTVYSRDWNNVPAGEHSLFARVVLDNGQSFDTRPIRILSLEDTNDNHIDDAWEREYFEGNLVEGLADSDGDRYPNVYEYLHGTNPDDDQNYPQFSGQTDAESPITSVGSVRYYRVDSSLATETDYEKQTIQAVLNVAEDYDIIEVLPGSTGSYNEAIDILDKVFLFAKDYANSTTLDGAGLSDSVIRVLRESVIDGFTIRGGGVSGTETVGGGLYITLPSSSDEVRLVGCRVVDNEVTSRGGAIYLHTGALTLVSSSLVNNTAPQSAGIHNYSSSSVIRLINSLAWNHTAGNGDEFGGILSNLSFQSSLYRGDANGTVFIDGISQGTTNPGITPYYGIYHTSLAANAGNSLLEHSRVDANGEDRDDGQIDIGADEAVDSNGDGVAEEWMEHYAFTNIFANTDGDTLNQREEYQNETDPFNSDTDSDNVADDIEIFQTNTDPLVSDNELLDSDLNDDGIDDSTGIYILGIALTETNNDGDSLTNAQEKVLGTDPNRADTDGDGALDGVDEFPLDPSRFSIGSPNGSDTVSPDVFLRKPPDAVLQ